MIEAHLSTVDLTLTCILRLMFKLPLFKQYFEEKMTEVESADHLSILNLYAGYAHAIDSGDGHEYASCYASEGRYRSSTFG